MNSSERMFEGIMIMLNYCVEMKLDEEAQIMKVFIARWEKMDYNARKLTFDTCRSLMRQYTYPRRMPTQLELDLEDLKVTSFAASKAYWDVIGHLQVKRKRANSVTNYSLFESLEDFQEYQYRQTRGIITKLINEGLFTFGRDEDDKFALKIKEEEE